jgi:hypothetical protein
MPVAQPNTTAPKPVTMPVAQPDTTAPKPVTMPAPPMKYVPGSASEAPDESMQPSSKKATKENIFSLNNVVDEILNRK